ncbi:hypothetical protein chiPu_0001279 [Chiloscyllium punctatum]|uniref:Uncharacterized protein n=1 Tax=Chiloscyllium punctatum TaxID=137246 RepID=A0A401RXS2_CHIPU|nr:hypothetical protein [Chiloscyllium punctatum]
MAPPARIAVIPGASAPARRHKGRRRDVTIGVSPLPAPHPPVLGTCSGEEFEQSFQWRSCSGGEEPAHNKAG